MSSANETREFVATSQAPRIIANVDRLESAILAPEYADMIEIRLDRVIYDERDPKKTAEEIRQATEASRIPILASIRRNSDGGGWYRFMGTEPERFELFCDVMPFVDAVDVEYDAPFCSKLLQKASALNRHTVISYHNFFHTDSRSNLDKILTTMLQSPARMMKLVCQARTREDTFAMMDFLRDYVRGQRDTRPMCVISMGDLGRYTRVVFPYLGSAVTYGYVRGDEATYAGGQYRIDELRSYFSKVPFPKDQAILSEDAVRPILERVLAVVGTDRI